MVIGKGVAWFDALVQTNKLTGKRVHTSCLKSKQPDLDAHLVGKALLVN